MEPVQHISCAWVCKTGMIAHPLVHKPPQVAAIIMDDGADRIKLVNDVRNEGCSLRQILPCIEFTCSYDYDHTTSIASYQPPTTAAVHPLPHLDGLAKNKISCFRDIKILCVLGMGLFGLQMHLVTHPVKQRPTQVNSIGGGCAQEILPGVGNASSLESRTPLSRASGRQCKEQNALFLFGVLGQSCKKQRSVPAMCCNVAICSAQVRRVSFWLPSITAATGCPADCWKDL